MVKYQCIGTRFFLGVSPSRFFPQPEASLMAQERIYFIIFLLPLVPFLPYALSALQEQHHAAILDSLPLRPVANVFNLHLPLQARKANSCVSFTEFLKPLDLFMDLNLSAKLDIKPRVIESAGDKPIVVLAAAFPPVLAFMAFTVSVCFSFKKIFKKPRAAQTETPPESSNQDPDLQNFLAPFQMFHYRELRTATKNFNVSELLGTGVYASVYRATFPAPTAMKAVKRFIMNPESFKTEVAAIHHLHHPHILELKGWCTERPDEPLLVYDYMHNRSLDTVLWGHTPLPWPQRYKIAVGVAKALKYLHEECDPLVIHGDIQEGNVMLDEDFNPKLGDFGVAITGAPYKLPRYPTAQDPPECELDAPVTEKIDVYLFGAVLLNLCIERREDPKQFIEKVRVLKRNDTILQALDPKFAGKKNGEEILRVLDVGLQCVEKRIQNRPSMGRVLKMLLHARERRSWP